MLTHSTLLKLVHHGDWFTSIDLKDAYFHIKIYPPHRKFLRFSFLGRGKRIPGSTIRLVSQRPSVCKMYRSGTDSAQGEGHSSRYLRMLYEDLWSLPPEIHEIPFQCSVAVVLSFLQGLIDQGKAFSTIKVYLAAICLSHWFWLQNCGAASFGMQVHERCAPHFASFKTTFPSWDLGLVLDALSISPFEPLDKVDFKILSFKTALRLALASAKRVSEIHAFSVHSACLQFMSGDAGVFLKPNPAFMPKILKAIIPLELRAFYSPPFASSEQQKLKWIVSSSCFTHLYRKN